MVSDQIFQLTVNKFLEEREVERFEPIQEEQNLAELFELPRLLVTEREGEAAAEKWREAAA